MISFFLEFTDKEDFAMLEKASLEEIAKLRIMPGKEVAVLAIATCELGTLIRVQTFSGNHYLFEVTDPVAHRAHMVRCDSSRGHENFGYRGERIVSRVFRIGDQIFHWTGAIKDNLGNTSAVAGITILSKEV